MGQQELPELNKRNFSTFLSNLSVLMKCYDITKIQGWVDRDGRPTLCVVDKDGHAISFPIMDGREIFISPAILQHLSTCVESLHRLGAQ